MLDWAHGCASDLYMSEVHTLSRDKALHFNATKARATQITGFNISAFLDRVSSGSPYFWSLIAKLTKVNVPTNEDRSDAIQISPQHVVSTSTMRLFFELT